MAKLKIPPHVAKFIYSQRMEDSETKKQIINLGEVQVKELDPEQHADTLLRWMIHYIAEQIEHVKHATGNQKAKLERHCFNTILKLWQHRSSLPNGHRPFEAFEPIFKALNRLDPESPQPYYFEDFLTQKETDNTPGAKTNDVQLWINIAVAVDRAARVLLDFTFKQAAHHATDEETISWIKNSEKLSSNDDDLSVLIRLIPAKEDNRDKDALERIRQDQENNLRSKIEKLDVFLKYSRSLRAALVSKIEKLSKE